MASNSTTEMKIGDRMEDGTIYAGISRDTGKPMYATPADAKLTYTFNEAADYAAKLNLAEIDPEKRTWHVPTKPELNVLFQNRAAIGGFDTSGSHPPAGWYWSSSLHNSHAWVQRFSDGTQDYSFKDRGSSLRCVR